MAKFEKYWRNSQTLFAIAAILDPRYKMQVIEYSFGKIYGKDCDEASVHVSRIRKAYVQISLCPILLTMVITANINKLFYRLFTLFSVEYDAPERPIAPAPQASTSSAAFPSVTIDSHNTDMEDFDLYLADQESTPTRTDLERYLDDPLFRSSIKDFDILDWWKVHEAQYPLLARMARDILAVPATTVASESVGAGFRRTLLSPLVEPF